jgi:arylsulfatase A-like enzyme
MAPFAEMPPRQPNIVLVITDDQGYGDLGLHGNARIRTPNLDRLGRESVRFSRFYVCPVCSPTRACLMTGRWNYRTGVVDTYLGRSMMHPDEVTLAEALKAGGYRTGIFGKWHLGDNYPMRPQDQGFDEGLINRGGGLTQPSDPEGNSYFDPILYRNGRQVKTKGYCTDVVTDAALRFIERNRRKPFFAYISTVAPHVPLQIAERWWKPYADAGLDDTTAKVYGMVENIDANVGRIMGRLRELGLERDTILIFMTDNGPQQARYNAGMRGLKATVYEGGIRVPFFVRWPARLEPRVVEPIGANVDIMPTLLDLAGAPRPEGVRMDGVSLAGVLSGGPSPAPDRALFFQWHRGDVPQAWRDCCVVTQSHKLVNGKELYDLRADPAEAHDIAADRPEVVRDLRARYERWFADVSSTRGYDPPRIVVGDRKENPTILTRQDWRGPRATWQPDGEGYWELDVAEDGLYDITLRLWPDRTPAPVAFRCDRAEGERRVRSGTRHCAFRNVALRRGPARLEAWMGDGASRVGVMYSSVKRRSVEAGAAP